MIKKILLVPLLSIFLFAGVVQAQAQTNDLPNPGMLPDSPFYFLKNWSENIRTFFITDNVAKAERFLNLSEKRLAEANALKARERSEIAERTIERYQDKLDKALVKAEEAREKGIDTDEVLNKVSAAMFKHQEVLADIYEQIPEQAKSGIEQAMQASMQRQEQALEAISSEKREEAMENLEIKRQEREQRFEELRNRGVPVPEIPERNRARQEIEELNNEVDILETSNNSEIPAEAANAQNRGGR